MKRTLLAAAILVALALPQPSMATEGCVAGDRNHNHTMAIKLSAAFQALTPLGEEAREKFARNPSDLNLAMMKQVLALLKGTLEMYQQCLKIMTAGEPT